MEYLAFMGRPHDRIWNGITRLQEETLGSAESLEDIHNKSNVLVLAAVIDQRVVGYKIGYERKPGHFYSWVGAVDSSYRKLGIASELMRMQHQWCQQHNYSTIRTHTKNKWRNMLILNIRHGFDVIGTFTDDKGEPKIILQKNLDSFR